MAEIGQDASGPELPPAVRGARCRPGAGAGLTDSARASDTVARYGGDEFVVLCEDDPAPLDVARVATAIRAACAEPVQVPSGESVLPAASVGVA